MCRSVKVHLGFAVGDSALTKIVRRQLDRNAVAGDNANEMLAHFAGNVSYDSMAVLKFDAKLSTRKGLDNRSRQLDYFLIGSHKYNFRENYIRGMRQLQQLF